MTSNHNNKWYKRLEMKMAWNRGWKGTAREIIIIRELMGGSLYLMDIGVKGHMMDESREKGCPITPSMTIWSKWSQIWIKTEDPGDRYIEGDN